MNSDAERFVQMDMRAMRLANMTLRENFALSAPWRYTLWLGGMVVRHFNSLDDVEAYLAEIARSSEARYRDHQQTITDARTGEF